MTAFLGSIGSFVYGLMAVEIPGVGIPMLGLILGLWMLFAVGYACIKLFFGG